MYQATFTPYKVRSPAIVSANFSHAEMVDDYTVRIHV
jgi:hypothetical protein